jgi:streptogramin lyase
LTAFAILAIAARSAEKLSESSPFASTGQAQITSISPAQGPIAGGTEVTLTGSGFTGTTFTLDNIAITPKSASDTQIVFITPKRDNGIASVKLSGNGPNAYAEFLYLPPAVNTLPPGYITTVMGIGQFEGDGRIATKAQIAPMGIVLEDDGSIYFSEPNGSVIRVIRPTHVIERFAGTTYAGSTGDGGPALQAALGHPRGLEVDSAGNILLADSVFTNAVRRIDINTGVITTIAGGVAPGFSGDGGLAKNAKLRDPLKLARDGKGNLYVLDWGNVRIRRIDATTGVITTIAGNGTVGYSGDGGPATSATFNIGVDDFGGLAADADGNVYLADSQNRAIRRIDAQTGIITTFFQTDIHPGDYANAVTTDAAGNVYVAINVFDPTAPRIFKISPTGQVIQSWGKGDGFSEDGSAIAGAHLGMINGIKLDGSGNIIYDDGESSRIRRINMSTGLLETLAGIGPNVIGETGSALATLISMSDVLFLLNGDLLIGDTGSLRIRRVGAQGNVSDFAGNGFLTFEQLEDVPAVNVSLYPVGLGLAPNGDILVVSGVIQRIDSSGYIHLAAGGGNGTFSGDGDLATNASFHQPWGVAIDGAGNLFIADTNNNRIRRVDATTDIINTIAGSGPANPDEGYNQGTTTGDGGPAASATINTPYATAIDTDGTIWIDETLRILRKIDPNGIIHTFTKAPTVDAVSQLRLNAAHNLFFANYRVEPNGHIFSYGLSQGTQGLGDGGPAAQAKWGGVEVQLLGIDTNSEGDIFFSDSVNHRIRAIRYGAVIAEPGSSVSATNGVSQTVPVCTTFPIALQVTLRSPVGNLENGIRVDFSTPPSGPSCTFPNGEPIYSVLTDSNGQASAVCTANSEVGSYLATATPLNLGQSASFSLGNAAGQTPCPTPTVTPTPSPTPNPTSTPTASPTPTSTPTPTLIPVGIVGNVSTRLPVGTDTNVLIEGFIVQGPAGSAKKIIVRAIGPSLIPFGIADALANPTLEIHDASNATVAANDNWKTTQVGGLITGDQSAEIAATQLAPSNNLESAIIANLAPGSYTAVVRGLGNTVGTGVVDAYDISAASTARLANIATRGLIQPSDKLMIAGFIVQNAPVRVVVSALGPSLAAFGISNALPDTTLQLRDQNGSIVRENDDWMTDQKAELQATGLQPTNNLEAALVQTIPPGQYTAQVRGKPETTGTGVVQVFFLQ